MRGPLGIFFKSIWRCWRAEGKEKVPEHKVIIAANHVSKADPAIIMSHFWRPVRYLAKEELFESKITAFFYRSIGQIPVGRGKSDRVAFKAAIDSLNNGDRVGIFPEGTRVERKTRMRPHTGAVRLALLTDAQIIPCGISGSREAFPRDKFPRFANVGVEFGEPYVIERVKPAEEYSYDELQELSNELLYDRIMPLVKEKSSASP